MASKSLKHADTHPYLIVKKYLDPVDQPKFRYFKEAQRWMIRDVEKLRPMFRALNDRLGLDCLDDLVEQVKSLTDRGGVVAGVIDPKTQMMYEAEIVKRTSTHNG